MRYLITPLLLLLTTLPSHAADQVAGAKSIAPVVGIGSVLQLFVALFVVLALIIVTARVVRRFSAAGFIHKGALNVLAGVQVGQRERIVLIQAGEVQMLLGVAPGAVNTLHVFDKPVLIEKGEGSGAERFAERLMIAMGRQREEQK